MIWVVLGIIGVAGIPISILATWLITRGYYKKQQSDTEGIEDRIAQKVIKAIEPIWPEKPMPETAKQKIKKAAHASMPILMASNNRRRRS